MRDGSRGYIDTKPGDPSSFLGPQEDSKCSIMGTFSCHGGLGNQLDPHIMIDRNSSCGFYPIEKIFCRLTEVTRNPFPRKKIDSHRPDVRGPGSPNTSMIRVS